MDNTLKGFAKSANLSPDSKVSLGRPETNTVLILFTPQHPGIPELIGPLITAEGVASSCRQWRLHEQIITGFSSLVHCLTSDQLYSRIVPILMKNITNKVYTVIIMCKYIIYYIMYNTVYITVCMLQIFINSRVCVISLQSNYLYLVCRCFCFATFNH